jgi:cysteine desulfurase
LRPGTENFPGIVGLGVAAKARYDRLAAVQTAVGSMRNQFEAALLERFPFIRVNGDVNQRVFNTTNLCFQGLDGQALVARLDAHDVRCSQSSACTNSRPEASYVLRAMGLSENDAYASIRFAFSELNTPEDTELAVERISQSVETLAAILA